jgi:hypothetical protein
VKLRDYFISYELLTKTNGTLLIVTLVHFIFFYHCASYSYFHHKRKKDDFVGDNDGKNCIFNYQTSLMGKKSIV